MFDPYNFEKLFETNPNASEMEQLKDAAKATYGIFKVFTEAGFTEDQAMAIVTSMLSTGLNKRL